MSVTSISIDRNVIRFKSLQSHSFLSFTYSNCFVLEKDAEEVPLYNCNDGSPWQNRWHIRQFMRQPANDEKWPDDSWNITRKTGPTRQDCLTLHSISVAHLPEYLHQMQRACAGMPTSNTTHVYRNTYIKYTYIYPNT